MRRNILFLVMTVLCVATGCNNNTYSNLRNKEDKLIANYISRNGLVILTEEPATDYVWGEKEYYKVQGYDNFYFHLISRGDSVYIDSISPTKQDTVDLSIVLNDVVIARYRQFALTENADTLSYWTTLEQAYPYEFHYGMAPGREDDEVPGFAVRDHRTQQTGLQQRTINGNTVCVYIENQSETII